MSLNKVIIIGFVGKDPEVKYFDGGNALANITVATSERGYKLQNGTEVPERTEWHNVSLRGNNATFAEKWIKKGSLVYVEGKIRTRDYEKDGIKRYITEIHADKVEFFNSGNRRTDGAAEGTTSAAPAASAATEPTQPNFESGNSADDLPF